MEHDELILSYSETYAKTLDEYAKSTVYSSEIAFLATHNGFRPSCMHLFIGTSGGGKSTLFKTMFFDAYKNMRAAERIGIWYSEESRNDLIAQFANHPMVAKVSRDKKTMFYSETDNEDKGPRLFMMQLEEMFKKCKIIFFDNLTTSRLYEGKSVGEQQAFAQKLKALAKKYDVALVVMAHADSKFGSNSNRAMEQNDIRGPKTICNLAEYLYTVQMFIAGVEKNSFLMIKKHRGTDIDHSIFMFTYEPTMRIYSEIKAVPFSTFNMFYQTRDKLTDKKG